MALLGVAQKKEKQNSTKKSLDSDSNFDKLVTAYKNKIQAKL